MQVSDDFGSKTALHRMPPVVFSPLPVLLTSSTFSATPGKSKHDLYNQCRSLGAPCIHAS
jgi:hypothetical protein